MLISFYNIINAITIVKLTIGHEKIKVRRISFKFHMIVANYPNEMDNEFY